MIVLDFIRNIIGVIIFAIGGVFVIVSYPILAPTGRKWIKTGILQAINEHFNGTPANKSGDVVTARVDPREETDG